MANHSRSTPLVSNRKRHASFLVVFTNTLSSKDNWMMGTKPQNRENSQVRCVSHGKNDFSGSIRAFFCHLIWYVCAAFGNSTSTLRSVDICWNASSKPTRRADQPTNTIDFFHSFEMSENTAIFCNLPKIPLPATRVKDGR